MDGWRTLFNLGLEQHSKIEERVAVRSVNVVLFCATLLSLAWLFVAVITSSPPTITVVNLISFTGCLLGFALQRAGFVGAARWLSLAILAFYWLAILVAVGPKQGTEYFFAAIVLLPILVVSRANRLERYASVCLLLGVFLGGIYASNNVTPWAGLSPATLAIGYKANALLLGTVVFATISYYKNYAASGVRDLEANSKANSALLSRLLPQHAGLDHSIDSESEAHWHPNAVVVYVSLQGLGQLYTRLEAQDLVEMIDELFLQFDGVIRARSLEKVKTLGTTYVAVLGLVNRPDSALPAAEAALDLRSIVSDFSVSQEIPISFHCGIATGMTISGVIGSTRPRFDIWGEALETASSLASFGGVGEILVDLAIQESLGGSFDFEPTVDEQAFRLKKKH